MADRSLLRRNRPLGEPSRNLPKASQCCASAGSWPRGVMCISRPMSRPDGRCAVIFKTPRARRSKMKGMMLAGVAWIGLLLSFAADAARDAGAPDALLVHQIAAE